MDVQTHDHCGGMAVLPFAQRQEIEKAILACTIVPARGAASKIGAAIEKSLVDLGWSRKVNLSRDSRITITSMKHDTGLCLQTGNMSRMYADLLKLQHMFLKGTIKVGVMIVPSHAAAKSLGDNITNAERLTREVEIFRNVVHMPLVVYSFA
jgi:hypothetical protein